MSRRPNQTNNRGGSNRQLCRCSPIACAFIFSAIVVTVMQLASHHSHIEEYYLHFRDPSSSANFDKHSALSKQVLQPTSDILSSSSAATSSSIMYFRKHKTNLYDLDHSNAFHEMQELQRQHSKSKTKIAYVFAGSTRSFSCAKVHWSIRNHLIDALGGDPHVFIRVSTEDNQNTKTGFGVNKQLSLASENALNQTLRILHPRRVQYFKFSEQREEMELLYPGKMHSIVRSNDLRRYSMFFHRSMAFRMVEEYEKEHNMRFDWVILARLDAQWLEPILPISQYQNDRVWVTETGYQYFNDQFMLVPRQFSDYVFELGTKIKHGIYCLGGPDIEEWQCDARELRTKKLVNESIIADTLRVCCKDSIDKTGFKLGTSERIHFRHLREGKIPVSLGRFPVFLTRIRGSDTNSCWAQCFRIVRYNYKRFVFTHRHALYPYMAPMQWPDSRGRGINVRDESLCIYMESPTHPWRPVEARVLNDLFDQNNNNNNYKINYIGTVAENSTKSKLSTGEISEFGRIAFDYSRNLQDQREEIRIQLLQKQQLLLQKQQQQQQPQHAHAHLITITGNNFTLEQAMDSVFVSQKDLEAWRIHPTFNIEGCLTSSLLMPPPTPSSSSLASPAATTTRATAADQYLYWDRCHDAMGNIYASAGRYDNRQVFFLYVFPHPNDPSFPMKSTWTSDHSLTPYSSLENSRISSASDNSPAAAVDVVVGNSNNNGNNKSATREKKVTRVVIPQRQGFKREPTGKLLCFTVREDPSQIMETAAGGAQPAQKYVVVLAPCSSDLAEPTQLFLSVQGGTAGAQAASTVGELRYAALPHLCLTRNADGAEKLPERVIMPLVSTTTTTTTAAASGTGKDKQGQQEQEQQQQLLQPQERDASRFQLQLGPCDCNGQLDRVMFGFELIYQ